MNRREFLKRLSAIPFVSMLISCTPMMNVQPKQGVAGSTQRGEELRFTREEDFLAWAREHHMPPEQLAWQEKAVNDWWRQHHTRPLQDGDRVWIVLPSANHDRP